MLCTNLSLRSNFLTALCEAKIISSKNLKKLRDVEKTREDKLILLLTEILPMCCPNQFPAFCKVLEKTKRKTIADKLIDLAMKMGLATAREDSHRIANIQEGLVACPAVSHVLETSTLISEAERTVFGTVYAKYERQYKQIHGEVCYMIEKTIHPVEESWRPLIVKPIFPHENVYDMDEEPLLSTETVFQERTPVKFTFPTVKYEDGARKKDLLVVLLKRNIPGLENDDIRFVGQYPNGLVYVITVPGRAALSLFCLLKKPLPHWSFSSFGPVRVEFYGLPGIEMKFNVSGKCTIRIESRHSLKKLDQ